MSGLGSGVRCPGGTHVDAGSIDTSGLEVRLYGEFGTVVETATGRLMGGIRRVQGGYRFHPSFNVAPWRKPGDTWTSHTIDGALRFFALWGSW